ncbi:DUF3168 domain-containing protein [Sulfitobacter aestuarii]|uniref:DUF3168 domain-containing protein n=1 Tax=Sulfitobacter aestuarii TaxID=2161676 RepID=A0ABW5U1V7_9RHOB
MSYGVSLALQVAVYDALRGDAALGALIGDAVYDAQPGGVLPEVYVQIGEEVVRDASDGSGAGSWHRFTVTVVCSAAGFGAAKTAAGLVSEALHDAALNLSRGRLVSLVFERARAARIEAGGARRIDLRFRARIEDG